MIGFSYPERFFYPERSEGSTVRQLRTSIAPAQKIGFFYPERSEGCTVRQLRTFIAPAQKIPRRSAARNELKRVVVK